MAALPSSPTLTNPDMILPYGSPSPATTSVTSREYRHISTQPRNGGSTSSGDDGEENMRRGVRRLFGNGGKHRRDDSDTALLIKEDRNGGLIQAESKLTRQHGHNGKISLLAPSPALHDTRSHKSSNDAKHDQVDNCYWEGFDGPIMETAAHPDLSGQPESINGDQDPSDRASTPDRKLEGLPAIQDEDENDPNSHAAMSKRAEQILANAKKRLLTMENNLNRARSGLNGRPSSSMSSFANHGHEPVSLYTIPGMHKGPDGLSPSDHRQGGIHSLAGGTKGHLRVFSEPSVPSSLHNGSRVEDLESGDSQSPGALKSKEMDSVHGNTSGEQTTGTARNWFWTGLNRNGGSTGRLNNALEPLQEDEPAPTSFDSPSHRSSPLSAEDSNALLKSDQQSSDSSSFDLEHPPTTGLTRARSTTQMRDLRDQMQDLKGKISNLKQRAREDSMRRRSLQSLRTPSPFTAAEQWYTGSPGHQLGNSTVITANVSRKRSLSFGKKKVEEGKAIEINNVRDNEKSAAIYKKEEQPMRDPQEHSDQNGGTLIDNSDNNQSSIDNRTTLEKEPEKTNGDFHTLEGDGPEVSRPEDEELPQSSAPVGERHEDRPDAFDYEHFYLHSGMGHALRQDLSRTSSHSSVYSVETAKPFRDVAEGYNDTDDDEDDYNLTGTGSGDDVASRHNGHFRQSSGESISTMATFATATEGRGGDEEADEEEWTNRRPMAGSWETEYSSKRNFNVDSRDAPAFHASRSAHEPGATVVAQGLPSAASENPSEETATPTRSSADVVSAGSAAPQMPLDLLSVLSVSTPLSEGTTAKAVRLGDRDKELVERLIQSLSKVCVQLHTDEMEGGKYECRVWRRRLDAARRVLEGEVNGEAF